MADAARAKMVPLRTALAAMELRGRAVGAVAALGTPDSRLEEFSLDLG